MSKIILKKNNIMPILFIGHGSPMNAIEENTFTKNFAKIANEIRKPKAILCISAHWVTDGSKVTAMDKPKTIHDFYGFPHELYSIEYKALGDVILAKKIQGLLYSYNATLNNDWGLDHGAWSILRHMYPKANIPVVQLSLDYNLSTNEHYILSQKLTSLREEDILIIGSGNIIHNLSEINFSKIDTDFGYDWANRVHKIINDDILKNEYTKILNYQNEDTDFNLAIPTPEHFWPLVYILALKEKNEKVKFFNDTLVGGSLSMTSLIIR